VYALHVLHCLQDLVLLPNATTGLNAVISSVKLQPGDTVYSLNIG
jgi:selenocysteine lyase/cysteine desulfurase